MQITSQISYKDLLYNVGFWDAVAWPVAAIVIFSLLKPTLESFFLILGEFLRKLKGKYNTKTGEIEVAMIAAQSKTETEDNLTGVTVGELLEGNPYLKGKISELSPIVEIQLTQSGVKNREEWLKARLIEFSIYQTFEIIYRVIFGSQIRLLQHLISQPNGVSRDVIRGNFYEQASRENPLFYATYNFDQWLTYMFNSHLLKNEEGLVKISADGRGFFDYLINRGYPLEKPL